MDALVSLSTAKEAARLAGKHMRLHLGTEAVSKSNKDDLVTVVDKQCQEIIAKHIALKHPSHRLLGEEDVAAGSDASRAAIQAMDGEEWLWIVDPIDGTTNFVHGRPASVVSIALAHSGQVIVGVIYDPYRDELFSAVRGHGAFLNDCAINVSQKETQFEQALVGFGIGTKPSVRLPMLDVIHLFSNTCRGLRLQGAAALELAWTACGRQTGFFELDLNSWDVAAGSLLVTEAGGTVTDSVGAAFNLHTRHIVASNGHVHADLLACIAQANATRPR
ncbi:inositol monophosphatase [Thraustotheca clavata]|uniref:Inositol-1-monophosphatase n=1 Tax=Thraustotheca clavata TaxID=74557 RepID=A0A1W0A7K5_9STRA|nr:inositol monophosphatase [Thraustotheca clavata]